MKLKNVNILLSEPTAKSLKTFCKNKKERDGLLERAVAELVIVAGLDALGCKAAK